MLVMTLLDKRGGYLYQTRPDIIPQPWLTTEEVGLWCAFYERRESERQERRNG
jgi:hypothetical protein